PAGADRAVGHPGSDHGGSPARQSRSAAGLRGDAAAAHRYRPHGRHPGGTPGVWRLCGRDAEAARRRGPAGACRRAQARRRVRRGWVGVGGMERTAETPAAVVPPSGAVAPAYKVSPTSTVPVAGSPGRGAFAAALLALFVCGTAAGGYISSAVFDRIPHV